MAFVSVSAMRVRRTIRSLERQELISAGDLGFLQGFGEHHEYENTRPQLLALPTFARQNLQVFRKLAFSLRPNGDRCCKIATTAVETAGAGTRVAVLPLLWRDTAESASGGMNLRTDCAGLTMLYLIQ
jgi:hypothetical protein